MSEKSRPAARTGSRFSYANVVATTALVLVVVGGGGTAVAAGLAKNSVGSPQIKNGQVKTVDLGAGSVKGPKVADESLTGADVSPDSLTGADINESTLVLPAQASVSESPISSIGTLTGAFANAQTFVFTAPSAGYVKVSASANFNARSNGTFVNARLLQDGTAIRTTYMDPGDVDFFYDQVQSIEGAIPVTAGPHTYAFQLSETAASTFANYYNAQIVVEFFPAGTATVTPRALPGQG
jgi:hypothetical protein